MDAKQYGKLKVGIAALEKGTMNGALRYNAVTHFLLRYMVAMGGVNAGGAVHRQTKIVEQEYANLLNQFKRGEDWTSDKVAGHWGKVYRALQQMDRLLDQFYKINGSGKAAKAQGLKHQKTNSRDLQAWRQASALYKKMKTSWDSERLVNWQAFITLMQLAESGDLPPQFKQRITNPMYNLAANATGHHQRDIPRNMVAFSKRTSETKFNHLMNALGDLLVTFKPGKSFTVRKSRKAPVYGRRPRSPLRTPAPYDERAFTKRLERLYSSVRNSSGKVRNEQSARVFKVWQKELVNIARMGPEAMIRDHNYRGALETLQMGGWSTNREFNDRVGSLVHALDELLDTYTA